MVATTRRASSGTSPTRDQSSLSILSVDFLGKASSKAQLVERLQLVHKDLKHRQQGQGQDELEDLALFLAGDDLLENHNRELRVLVACCLADIMRIFAPSAPFSETRMRSVFFLFVRHLRGIEDVESPLWTWHFSLLEKLSLVKAFVVVADDEEIVRQTFENLFAAILETHSYKVSTLVQNIMVTIIEETDQPVRQWLLDVLLQPLVTNGSTQSQELAFSVLRRCTSMLQSPVSNFLNGLLAQESSLQSELAEHKKDLIIALNKVSSDFLLYVIPNLERELTSGREHNRLEAVDIMGRVFSERESSAVKDYPPLYKGFLRRFTDIESSVRKEVCSLSAAIVKSHPWTAADFIPVLKGRLMDTSEKVRELSVRALFAMSEHCSQDDLKTASERMLDKHIDTRRATIESVAQLLANYVKEKDLKASPEDYEDDESPEWIVPSLLRSSKALRSNGDLKSLTLIEKSLFQDTLLPLPELVEESMTRWLSLFEYLEKDQLDMLKELLATRVTFQKQVKSVATFKTGSREAATEGMESKEAGEISTAVKPITSESEMVATLTAFVKSLPVPRNSDADTTKKLKQMMKSDDPSFYEDLIKVCNVQISFEDSRAALLRIQERFLGADEKSKLLAETFFPRCLAGVCAQENLQAAARIAAKGKKKSKQQKFASWFLCNAAPLLPEAFEGVSEYLADLLLDSKTPSVALQILSSMGECFRVRGSRLSSVNEQLVQQSLQDDIHDSKWAARALIRMNGDDGSLPVWSSLVPSMQDRLKGVEKEGLPSVHGTLMSLSQIVAKSVEAWKLCSNWTEDFCFKLLRRELKLKVSACKETETSCICAIKCLARGVARHRHLEEDAYLSKVRDVLEILMEIIAKNGDIFDLYQGSEDESASDLACARIRLAASSSILRISRTLKDNEFFVLRPESFLKTVLITQDRNPDIRLAFAEKLYKGILRKKLQMRWIVGMVFMAVDPDKQNLDAVKRFMATLIKVWRAQVENKRNEVGTQRLQEVLRLLPESVLPSVIWMIAHHPDLELDMTDDYKDSRKYLELFFSRLLVQSDYASFLLQLLQTIVLSRDATDTDAEEISSSPAISNQSKGTQNIRAIANLGLEILRGMQSGRKWDLTEYPGTFNLPEELYRTNTKSKTLLRAAKEFDKPRRLNDQSTADTTTRMDKTSSEPKEKKVSTTTEQPTMLDMNESPKVKETSSTTEHQAKLDEDDRPTEPRAKLDKNEGSVDGANAKTMEVQESRSEEKRALRPRRLQSNISNASEKETGSKRDLGEGPEVTTEEKSTPKRRRRGQEVAVPQDKNVADEIEIVREESKENQMPEESSHLRSRRERKQPKRYDSEYNSGSTGSKSSPGTVSSKRSSAKAS